MFQEISIHTPARGVTLIKAKVDYIAFNFNPHSRTGSDQRLDALETAVADFNPHSRTGSDGINGTLTLYRLSISIHTPARGVTQDQRQCHGDCGFQSTLPHGE